MSSQWGDRYPYLDYIRHLDVRQLVEANAVVDTGASRDGDSSCVCFLCGGAAPSADALRLNHGKHVCSACLVDLQRTKYPEKYQRLYEAHVLASEAWRRASADLEKELRAEYSTASLTQRIGAVKGWWGTGVGAGLLLGLAVPSVGLPMAGVSILVLLACVPSLWRQVRAREAAAEGARRAWLERNTPPAEPELRDFHDPRAELTARDEMLQEIFDYWPGYPPYWHYIRRIVLERDRRCQITGCPSRTEIHVHHKQPLARGGSHRPENLIALCAFHHGLQPDMGHEKVWLDISTQYFTMVCAHFRQGARVCAHVRRRSLVTELELLAILRFHGAGCPSCESEVLQLSINYGVNTVSVRCDSCGSEWRAPQKLTEETGPQLCELLRPTRNLLVGVVDWEIMAGKRRPVGQRKPKQTRPRPKTPQERRCPLCGNPLALRDGRYGRFWGCTSYPRCRYTRDDDGSGQRRKRRCHA